MYDEDDSYDARCPSCLECRAGYAGDLEDRVRDLGLRVNAIERNPWPLLNLLLALLSRMDTETRS